MVSSHEPPRPQYDKPLQRYSITKDVESVLVSLQEVFIDGTKIEANANRYTFVWGKAIKTNKAKMQVQLKELWEYAEKVANIEKDDNTPTDFESTDPEKVKATIEKIFEPIFQ